MKKLKILFFLAAGAVLGATLPLVLIYGGQDATAWVAYLREDVIPTAIAALLGTSLIYLAGNPVLKKVLQAIGLFEVATKHIESTAKSGQLSTEKAQALEEKIKAEYETIVKDNKELKELVTSLQRMVKMGFCNNADLVRGGIAREIAKIGGNEDEGTGQG